MQIDHSGETMMVQQSWPESIGEITKSVQGMGTIPEKRNKQRKPDYPTQTEESGKCPNGG